MNGIPSNFYPTLYNSAIEAWTDPHNPIWGAEPKPYENPIPNGLADVAQISSQSQEKPQATMPTIGTESQQSNQGIGSAIGDVLGGVNADSMQPMSTKSASTSKQAKPQGTKPNQAKPQNEKPQNANQNQEKPQSAWQGIVNLYHGVSNAVNTVSNAVNTVSDAYHGVVDTVSTVSHAVIDPIADVATVLEETTTVHGLTHPETHHHNYEYNPETSTITATPKK